MPERESTLNPAALAKDMLSASEGVLVKEWPKARKYAESAFKQLAENLVKIEAGVIAGTMDPEKARIHLANHKEATGIVLEAIEGIGKIAIEQAINAALGVVRDVVNKAVGFPLLA